jgi:hypothetical protein
MFLPVGGGVVGEENDRAAERRRKSRNGEEEEKQMALLMDWVTRRIDEAGDVPRLSDVIEQAGKGFGFNALSRRAVSAALRRHPHYHLVVLGITGP